eukprot:5931621-Pyramimonas_sp.AAC.1
MGAEGPECLQFIIRHPHDGGVAVAPPAQPVLLDAFDNLVHVKAAHAEIAPVAGNGSQQPTVDELHFPRAVGDAGLLGEPGDGLALREPGDGLALWPCPAARRRPGRIWHC